MGNTNSARTCVRYPLPDPMSKTRDEGVRKGRRDSVALACMCGADIVAAWPMYWGESS